MTDKMRMQKAERDTELLQILVAAQESERTRIFRDLHDDLGQQFTALRLSLEAFKDLIEDDAPSTKIDEIQVIAKHIDDGVDFLTWELRPAVLDDLGLYWALNKYIEEWSGYTGVSAELLANGMKDMRFSQEIETNLYLIVQEALNNAKKHAFASRVEILMDKRGGLLSLIIEDDGQGFDIDDKERSGTGIGLVGMRERAAVIRGTIEIESSPGNGTTIFVRIPGRQAPMPTTAASQPALDD